MKQVTTIRARTHPNIVKFFASFSAGRRHPWGYGNEKECLHMLFEHTSGGNMRDWLIQTSAPETFADVGARQDHIAKSISSLIDAVTYIPKEIGGHVAFHHDLKPGNILRFGDHPATWKICDFGMANIKRTVITSETSRVSNGGIGTYEYQPPEYFQDDPSYSKVHGRPFDVWSLGCVLLELLTVWKYGWSETSGLKDLKKRMRENTQRTSPNRRRYMDSSGLPHDYSFHNNRSVVTSWIDELRENEENTWFSLVIGLVSEMLIEKAKRIFIWEVHMDLYEKENPRLSESKLTEFFHDVAQLSGNLNIDHNPLRRSMEKKKEWQVAVLKSKHWSDNLLEATPQQNMRNEDAAGPYSTLERCSHWKDFQNTPCFGRHEIDSRMAEEFKYSHFVGLHGLGGIGYDFLSSRMNSE
ncbi:kinase-like domain-containing protein [Clohesyomyces aquaticus]|uniref:Kinase-like domain-containing protein n=1 Tax=Clohesyomyces aquaticus TaxID=1231657 RepID=A0A1Y1Z892_9PLEO|nr:kinase-like domain-containing protein [Clohesyomyces aquaticus]